MFWSALYEAEPNTEKMCHHAQNISRGVKVIRDIYAKVTRLNPTNLMFLYKYGLFLRYIVHDEIESAQIISKLKNGRALLNEKRWNSWDGTTVLIRASGDQVTLGCIMDISFEGEIILGLAKKDAVGMSYKRLMLPMISERHDDWLIAFYKNMKPKTINNTSLFFFQHVDKHYVQCECYKAVVPRLDDRKVEFAIFLRRLAHNPNIPPFIEQIEKTPGAIISSWNGRIVGVNSQATKYLGIPTNISEKECFLSQLFPECETQGPAFESKNGKYFKMELRQFRERLPPELIERKLDEEIGMNQTPGGADFEMSMWGKLVNETYGENAGNSTTIRIFYFLPLGSAQGHSVETFGKMANSANMKHVPGIVESGDNHGSYDLDENMSGYTSSASSSHSSGTQSEASMIKQFKYQLYERRYPFSVICSKKVLAFLFLILFGIHRIICSTFHSNLSQ